MSSATASSGGRSAAWRISLAGTVVFAIGSLMVFLFMAHFTEGDIERRTDTWLTGEMSKLQEDSAHLTGAKLQDELTDQIQEISREVPGSVTTADGRSDQVFFLQVPSNEKANLWVGAANATRVVPAVLATTPPAKENKPYDLRVDGMKGRFRVTSASLHDGGRMYLGVSSFDQHRVLHSMRSRFVVLWFVIVVMGFGVLFWMSRRMLNDVRQITEAASHIGETDLSMRVPMSGRRDEAAQLAATLNMMLARIETSMQQVHTMTGALAHDLRSPLTAIRAKLEMSLTSEAACCVEAEEIVSAIDEIDRLTELLTKSLDVAEAKADALRLKREVVDLTAVLAAMAELYSPSFAERSVSLKIVSDGAMWTLMDASLLHRMMANLFDNELKHVPAGSAVEFALVERGGNAVLRVSDNGGGFAPEVLERMFETRVKGPASGGHGLGLAFVQAVVLAHGGAIRAGNDGGAWLEAELPLAPG